MISFYGISIGLFWGLVVSLPLLDYAKRHGWSLWRYFWTGWPLSIVLAVLTCLALGLP